MLFGVVTVALQCSWSEAAVARPRAHTSSEHSELGPPPYFYLVYGLSLGVVLTRQGGCQLDCFDW
jgi:hypothetical protein